MRERKKRIVIVDGGQAKADFAESLGRQPTDLEEKAASMAWAVRMDAAATGRDVSETVKLAGDVPELTKEMLGATGSSQSSN